MSRRAAAVLVLAFVGMVDTLYLSLSHSTGPVPCHITAGCGDVLTSRFSEVAGIPISWFGFVFYFAAFTAAVYEGFGGARALALLRWPSAAALGVSAVLTGIQVFVLQAFCEYCLTSAALSTTIFLLVWTGREKPEPASLEPVRRASIALGVGESVEKDGASG